MSQPNPLELAKQGHPKAIESLINRQTQPKGITAKVALKNNCLHIMLEAAQPPDQKALVPVIRKGITNLGVPSIEILKIYGKQAGEQVPAWSQEFELVGQKLETQQKELDLDERAKQGDIEAITKLLNIALKSENITAKGSIKSNCLQLMLESKQAPNKQVSISIVRRELINLKAITIKKVNIYGRQTGEEFPAWNQQLGLVVQPNPAISLAKKASNEFENRLTESIEEDEPNIAKTSLAFAQKVRFLHEKTQIRVLDCIDALREANGDSKLALYYIQQNNYQENSESSYQLTPHSVLVESELRCPKCNSSQLTNNKKGFGLGQAAAGAILLGPIGLLGGFMGSNKVVVTCLKCGHSWQPGQG